MYAPPFWVAQISYMSVFPFLTKSITTKVEVRKEKHSFIQGVTDVEAEINFEPPWDRGMISEAALLELGLLQME